MTAPREVKIGIGIGLAATLIAAVVIAAISGEDADVAKIMANAPTHTTPDLIVRSMEVGAYCPCKKCCGPDARGVTSSRRPVTAYNGRIIASDMPVGTAIHVPGYGWGIVCDTGPWAVGDRIEVLFRSHAQAVKWGVQRLDVTIKKAVQ